MKGGVSPRLFDDSGGTYGRSTWTGGGPSRGGRLFFRPSRFAPALTPSTGLALGAECKSGKERLTWRIRDDRVEQVSASPWILRDIEGAEVYDAISDAVLRGSADNSWWLDWGEG